MQGSDATVFQSDLNSLLETSKILNSSDELGFILSHILRTVMGKLLLTRACIVSESYQENLEKIYRVELARGLVGAPETFHDKDAFAEQFRLTLFPIISPKREIGYLGLGEKLSKTPFSEAEKSSLSHWSRWRLPQLKMLTHCWNCADKAAHWINLYKNCAPCLSWQRNTMSA